MAALRQFESSYNVGNRSKCSNRVNGGATSVTSSPSTSAADIPSLSQAHISASCFGEGFVTLNSGSCKAYRTHCCSERRRILGKLSQTMPRGKAVTELLAVKRCA
jgi:hypothetical protein